MEYCNFCYDDITPQITYHINPQPPTGLPYRVMSLGINAQGKKYHTDRCGHNMLLICLTLEGTGSVICGDECRMLNPGDLMVLDCMNAHHYRSECDCWKFMWIQVNGSDIHTLFHTFAPKGLFFRHFQDTSFIHELYQKLVAIIKNPSPLHEIDVSELIDCFIYQLARYSAMGEDDTLPVGLTHALTYIQDHIHEELTLETMAAAAGYSVYYFSRAFTKHFGVSPYRYVINLRLHHAARMLITTEESVEKIASLSKFSGVSRFISFFRRHYGITPLQYRKAKANEPHRV